MAENFDIYPPPLYPPTVRSKRWKRAWHIAAWVLGLVFFSKVDNILWGYLGLPTVNIMSTAVLGVAFLWLIISLLGRIFGTTWAWGTVAALLVFLAFEPFFPSPYAMHLVGYSMRVKEKLDIPAVRAWAQAYEFPAEASSSPSYARDDYSPPPQSAPGTLLKAGLWTYIRRSDRTVTVGNGGETMAPYGVIIGPATHRTAGEWDIVGDKMAIKLADDVYVWCGAP